MGTNYSTINLIKEIDILTNQALLDSINFEDCAKLFEKLCALSASDDIYSCSQLWCLITVLKRFNIESTILTILLESIEANLLVHKIYFQNEHNNVEYNCENNQYEDVRSERDKTNIAQEEYEYFREIAMTDNNSKIIMTKRRNKLTGEIIEVERRTVSEPQKLDLEEIFSGLLTEEIDNEN